MTLAVLEHRQKKLEEYWSDFVKRHRAIKRSAEADHSEYVKRDEFSRIEERYFEIAGQLANAIQAMTSKTTSSDPLVSQVEAGNAPKRVHLPKVDLPKFSGDLLAWENFKGLFKALIHDNAGIPNVLKLQYLKSSLSGEAANLLKNVAITDSGYEGAWQDLLDNYENQHLLLFKYMRNVVNCPPAAKQTACELKRLLTTVRQSKRAFEALQRPVEHWSDWFLFLTVEKLNTSSRMDWRTSATNSKKIPTFENLVDFLENRIQALEATFSKDSRAQSHGSKESIAKKKGTSVYHSATNDRKAKTHKCPQCQQGHTLGYCLKFKKFSFSQRKEQAQKLGACLNCLHTDHELSKCPSKYRCAACDGKHHTLLHSAVIPSNTANDLSQTKESASTAEDHSVTPTPNKVASYSVATNRVVLLATAQIQIESLNGNVMIVRALLDTASESSFITEWVAQTLRLPRRGVSVPISGIQGTSSGSASSEASLFVTSIRSKTFRLPLRALVLRTLSTMVPSSVVLNQPWPHLSGLPLADPEFAKPSRVDVILGADICGLLFENESRRGPMGSPSALLTVFGWVLMGSASATNHEKAAFDSVTSVHCQTHDCLSSDLRKFWELEEVNYEHPISPDDALCEELFKSTHRRSEDGCYVVSLPVRDGESKAFGHSRQSAMRLLFNTERRLNRNPSLKDKYTDFMQTYLDMGHMELVPDDMVRNDPNSCYLLHHAVVKPHDPLRKIRVVFNALFKTSSGFSLNDRLLPGPKLQAELWLVLTRWRLFRVVFTTDIVKMFRQIRVNPEDTNLQRILWRKDQEHPLKDYRLTTVTYGTTCAPYLALRVLRQLAEDERSRFPLGAKIIESHSYVDDIFAGADTVQQVKKARQELSDILSTGGFPLSKWAVNCSDIHPAGDTPSRSRRR
ncbi:bel12-ag transposon polyprotein [Lasius niger]|uniref:Bel12-ag transposon polyprotein n=1 Tax=Lasius niger TaxID=67767 RepID=A0A0J7KCT8_LASNI|nr:bel12-ag transposon polyprotein [Lasius niger]